MRPTRTFLTLPLLALAAACTAPDAALPTASGTGPAADAFPPSWIGACGPLVRFNVPAMGTTFGAPVAQAPGTLVFIENGVAVRTAQFMTGGGMIYDAARIEPAPATPFGDGQVLRMRDINFRFAPPAGGGPYFGAIVEYRDLGGIENFSVNGSPVYVGDIALLPSPYFGWSTGVTVNPVPGGSEGYVRIGGTVAINEIMIGGRNLWIDNVCFH